MNNRCEESGKVEDKNGRDSQFFLEKSGILSYTQKVLPRQNQLHRRGPRLCSSISQHVRHDVNFNSHNNRNHYFEQKYPGGALAHEESFSRDLFADTNDYLLSGSKRSWKKQSEKKVTCQQSHPITWVHKLDPQSVSKQKADLRPLSEQVSQIDEEIPGYGQNEADGQSYFLKSESSHEPVFITGMMDHQSCISKGWEAEMKVLVHNISKSSIMPNNENLNESENYTDRSAESHNKLCSEVPKPSGSLKNKNERDDSDEVHLFRMVTKMENENCGDSKIAIPSKVLNTEAEEVIDTSAEQTVSDRVSKTTSLSNLNSSMKSKTKLYTKRPNSEKGIQLCKPDPLQAKQNDSTKNPEINRKMSDCLKELVIGAVKDLNGRNRYNNFCVIPRNEVFFEGVSDKTNEIVHCKEPKSLSKVNQETFMGKKYGSENDARHAQFFTKFDRKSQASEKNCDTSRKVKRVSFGEVTYKFIEPRQKGSFSNNKNVILNQKIDKPSVGNLGKVKESKERKEIIAKDKIKKDILEINSKKCRNNMYQSAEEKRAAKKLFLDTVKRSERITDIYKQKMKPPHFSLEANKGNFTLQTFKIPKVSDKVEKLEHENLRKNAEQKPNLSEDRRYLKACESVQEKPKSLTDRKTNCVSTVSKFPNKTTGSKHESKLLSNVFKNACTKPVAVNLKGDNAEIVTVNEKKGKSGTSVPNCSKKPKKVNKHMPDYKTDFISSQTDAVNKTTSVAHQTAAEGGRVRSSEVKSARDSVTGTSYLKILKKPTEINKTVTDKRADFICCQTDVESKNLPVAHQIAAVTKTMRRSEVKNARSLVTRTSDTKSLKKPTDINNHRSSSKTDPHETLAVNETVSVACPTASLVKAVKSCEAMSLQNMKAQIKELNFSKKQTKINKHMCDNKSVPVSCQTAAINKTTSVTCHKAAVIKPVNSSEATTMQDMITGTSEAKLSKKQLEISKLMSDNKIVPVSYQTAAVNKIASCICPTAFVTKTLKNGEAKTMHDTTGTSKSKKHPNINKLVSGHKAVSVPCQASAEHKTVSVTCHSAAVPKTVSSSDAKTKQDLPAETSEANFSKENSEVNHLFENETIPISCQTAIVNKTVSVCICPTAAVTKTVDSSEAKNVVDMKMEMQASHQTMIKTSPSEIQMQVESVRDFKTAKSKPAVEITSPKNESLLDKYEQKNLKRSPGIDERMIEDSLSVFYYGTSKLDPQLKYRTNCETETNTVSNNFSSSLNEERERPISETDFAMYKIPKALGKNSPKLSSASKHRVEVNACKKNGSPKISAVRVPNIGLSSINANAKKVMDEKDIKNFDQISIKNNDEGCSGRNKEMNSVFLKNGANSGHNEAVSLFTKTTMTKERQKILKNIVMEYDGAEKNADSGTMKLVSLEKQANTSLSKQTKNSATELQCSALNNTATENDTLGSLRQGKGFNSKIIVHRPQSDAKPVSVQYHTNFVPSSVCQSDSRRAVVKNQFCSSDMQSLIHKDSTFSGITHYSSQNVKSHTYKPLNSFSYTTKLMPWVPNLNMPPATFASKTCLQGPQVSSVYQPHKKSSFVMPHCGTDHMQASHKPQFTFIAANTDQHDNYMLSSLCTKQTTTTSKTYYPVMSSTNQRHSYSRRPKISSVYELPSKFWNKNHTYSESVHLNMEKLPESTLTGGCHQFTTQVQPYYKSLGKEVNELPLSKSPIIDGNTIHHQTNHIMGQVTRDIEMQKTTDTDSFKYVIENPPVFNQQTSKYHPGQDSQYFAPCAPSFSDFNCNYNFPVYGMINSDDSCCQISSYRTYNSYNNYTYCDPSTWEKSVRNAACNQALERKQFGLVYFGNEICNHDRRNVSFDNQYMNPSRLQPTKSYCQMNSLNCDTQFRSQKVPSVNLRNIQQDNFSFSTNDTFLTENCHNRGFVESYQYSHPDLPYLEAFGNNYSGNMNRVFQSSQVCNRRNNINTSRLTDCETNTEWTYGSQNVSDKPLSFDAVTALSESSHCTIQNNKKDMTPNSFISETLPKVYERESLATNLLSTEPDIDFDRFYKEMKSLKEPSADSSSEFKTLIDYILSDAASDYDEACSSTLNIASPSFSSMSPPTLSPIAKKQSAIAKVTDPVKTMKMPKNTDKVLVSNDLPKLLVREKRENQSIYNTTEANTFSLQKEGNEIFKPLLFSLAKETKTSAAQTKEPEIAAVVTSRMQSKTSELLPERSIKQSDQVTVAPNTVHNINCASLASLKDPDQTLDISNTVQSENCKCLPKTNIRSKETSDVTNTVQIINCESATNLGNTDHVFDASDKAQSEKGIPLAKTGKVSNPALDVSSSVHNIYHKSQTNVKEKAHSALVFGKDSEKLKASSSTVIGDVEEIPAFITDSLDEDREIYITCNTGKDTCEFYESSNNFDKPSDSNLEVDSKIEDLKTNSKSCANKSCKTSPKRTLMESTDLPFSNGNRLSKFTQECFSSGFLPSLSKSTTETEERRTVLKGAACEEDKLTKKSKRSAADQIGGKNEGVVPFKESDKTTDTLEPDKQHEISLFNNACQSEKQFDIYNVAAKSLRTESVDGTYLRKSEGTIAVKELDRKKTSLEAIFNNMKESADTAAYNSENWSDTCKSTNKFKSTETAQIDGTVIEETEGNVDIKKLDRKVSPLKAVAENKKTSYSNTSDNSVNQSDKFSSAVNHKSTETVTFDGSGLKEKNEGTTAVEELDTETMILDAVAKDKETCSVRACSTENDPGTYDSKMKSESTETVKTDSTEGASRKENGVHIDFFTDLKRDLVNKADKLDIIKKKSTKEVSLYDSAAAFLGENFDQEIPRKRKRPKSLHTFLRNETTIGGKTTKRSADSPEPNTEPRIKVLRCRSNRYKNNVLEKSKDNKIVKRATLNFESLNSAKDTTCEKKIQQITAVEPCIQKKRGRKPKKSRQQFPGKGSEITYSEGISESVNFKSDQTKGETADEDKLSGTQKDKSAPELKVSLTDIMGKKNATAKSMEKRMTRASLRESSMHKGGENGTCNNKNDPKEKHPVHNGKRKAKDVKNCRKSRKISSTEKAVETVEFSQPAMAENSFTEQKNRALPTNSIGSCKEEGKCPVCGITIQPLEQLTHLKVAHPRHCDVCYIEFPSKNARQRHKVEYSSDVYECVPCNRKFLKLRFMNAHLRHCMKKRVDAAESVSMEPRSAETEQAVAALYGIMGTQTDEEQTVLAQVYDGDLSGDMLGTFTTASADAGDQSQTGSFPLDQNLNIIWGSNQVAINQSDGNTFVIEREADNEFNTEVQVKESKGLKHTDKDINNVSAPVENRDSINYTPVVFYDAETGGKLNSVAPTIDCGTYSCGLNLLADLCEMETVSRLTGHQEVPDRNEGTKEIVTVEQDALPAIVNESVAVYNDDTVLADIMSETNSLCRIASSFSLTSLNDRDAI